MITTCEAIEKYRLQTTAYALTPRIRCDTMYTLASQYTLALAARRTTKNSRVDHKTVVVYLGQSKNKSNSQSEKSAHECNKRVTNAVLWWFGLRLRNNWSLATFLWRYFTTLYWYCCYMFKTVLWWLLQYCAEF